MALPRFVRDLYYIKNILIVVLTPIVLLPFVVVESGGQVNRFEDTLDNIFMIYNFSLNFILLSQFKYLSVHLLANVRISISTIINNSHV